MFDLIKVGELISGFIILHLFNLILNLIFFGSKRFDSITFILIYLFYCSFNYSSKFYLEFDTMN